MCVYVCVCVCLFVFVCVRECVCAHAHVCVCDMLVLPLELLFSHRSSRLSFHQTARLHVRCFLYTLPPADRTVCTLSPSMTECVF